MGKGKDDDKVDWTLCQNPPEGDNWKWERSTVKKSRRFTLKNISNGKFLTAPGQYNVIVKDDETYFKNTLVHAWDDLQKKHCNMMREVSIEIGEPAFRCDNETLFGACGVGSWC